MDESQSKSGAAAQAQEPEKTPKKKERLALTDRDIALFKLIHEQRYAAYTHLMRAFWPDTRLDAKAGYRRLSKLEKDGYLIKEHSEKKKLNIFLLTGKGYEALAGRNLDSGLKCYERGKDYERFIDHDLKVTTIRIAFSEVGLKDWTSERVIRERQQLLRVPDGVLSINGHKAAIEFENYVTKGQKRYQELFESYRSYKDHFDFLFMILDGDDKSVFSDLDYDPQSVWFVRYNDLVHSGVKTVFSNKRASFRLRQLV